MKFMMRPPTRLNPRIKSIENAEFWGMNTAEWNVALTEQYWTGIGKDGKFSGLEQQLDHAY
jgi:hypothetical protein